MSKSWERRPRRRGAKHGIQRHRVFARRSCCRTHSEEAHAGSCRRDPVMCGVKVAFDFYREAAAHAVQMTAETGMVFRAYQCPWCELFHLTTRGPEQ